MNERTNAKKSHISQSFITKKELAEKSDTLINSPIGLRRLSGKIDTVREVENSCGNSDENISTEDFGSLENDLPSKKNVFGKSCVRIMLEEDGRFSDEEIDLIESSH